MAKTREIVGKEKATEGDGGLESGKTRLPAKKTRRHPTTGLQPVR